MYIVTSGVMEWSGEDRCRYRHEFNAVTTSLHKVKSQLVGGALLLEFPRDFPKSL